MKRNTTSLAKITRPSLTKAYPRERLFSLLDKGMNQSITWITGPPGSGKTTLVSDYIDKRKLDYLWYQVDQGETDIATFFYYMGLAVLKDSKVQHPASTIPDFGETISEHASYYFHSLLRKLDTLTGQVGSNLTQSDKNYLPRFLPEYFNNLETFTKSYFRELFSKLRTPFVIVFDNYDSVPVHSDFHDVIHYALTEIPPEGCVIFISRTDPPSSMAKFRANQILQNISWKELRLTRLETDGIVKSLGFNLTNEALEQLYNKTQGWAAGVVLLLEYFRTEGFVSEIPDSLTPQIIFDYLAGEIFQKFDEETKTFLLKTACLPRMTIEMAEEISGQNTANKILEELNHHHYFVTAKQTPGKIVYQYHPLFRDFLLALSDNCDRLPDEQKRLSNAATLLESNEQTVDAIELLISIEDWDQMLEIIVKHASRMIQSGRRETLSQWLEELPKEIMDKNPWMVYWLASCRFPFALRESRRLYEQAYRLFSNQKEKDVRGLLMASAGVINSILYELDDLALLDPWIDTLNRLLHEHHQNIPEDTGARVASSLFMAMIMRQPDNPDIKFWVDRAHKASESGANPNLRLDVEPQVALAYMWDGYFSMAREILDSLYETVSGIEVSPLEMIRLKNYESMCFMLIGNSEECIRVMREGLKLSQRSGVNLWNFQLLLNGLGAVLGNGELEDAEQLIGEIKSSDLTARRQELCLFNYFQAWYSILGNDKLNAFQFQKKALRLSIEIGNPYFEILCRLAMAQTLYDYGDEIKAAKYIKPVHDMARDIKNKLLEYMTLLSYSYIAMEHGRIQSGLSSLEYAMQVGREYGYMHTLWWRPDVMSKLCETALISGIETEYIQNLITRRNLAPLPTTTIVEQWPWHLKIYTLGQFSLLKNKKSISLVKKLQRKPIELLKALIARGGINIGEEILAKTLWPGVDDEYSLRSLTTTIHRLRKLLGEDKAIIVSDCKLSLNKEYVWLDVWAIEALISEIELNLLSDKNIDPVKLQNYIKNLHHLYQGPFMNGEPNQDWYETPREEIKNKYLRCISKIAASLEARNKWDEAINCYEQSLEIEKLTESFYRKLMNCYRNLNRYEDGIEVYLRCKKTFLSLLKTEPSTETRAIHDELINKLS